MSIQQKTGYSGSASSSGTKKFVEYAKSKGIDFDHFKVVENLYLSSLGMGTYLGNLSQQDNIDIENAVYNSITSGSINVIDTALNYRSMLSEKTIGRAIAKIFEENVLDRSQIFISTKNGYFTNDGEYPTIDIDQYLKNMFLDSEVIKESDISPSYNIMNPNYISRCIDKSLCNMGIETLDLVYIHNSFESWYNHVDKPTYANMLAKVFEVYEEYRKKGKINFYGMATWNCFTADPTESNYLSLQDIVDIAKLIGGENNGFRFIQLPYNIYMHQPITKKNQYTKFEKNLSLIDCAQKLGIHIFTSVPLLQGKLLHNFPVFNDIKSNNSKDEDVLKLVHDLPFQSLKLLQFIRSTPGVVAPLVGQKKTEHVDENLVISKYPLLTTGAFNLLRDILTN